MNSSDEFKEQGRAIARAMVEETNQRQKNMAKAEKRTATMLRRAADKELFRSN